MPKEAQNIAENLEKAELFQKILSLLNKGYFYKANYKPAERILNKFLKIFDKFDNPELKSLIMLYMARFYCYSGKDEYEEFYQRALNVLLSIDESKRSFPVIANIGSCYANLNDFKKTIEIYQNFLENPERLSKCQEFSGIYSTLGYAYLRTKEYSEGEKYLKLAIKKCSGGLYIGNKIFSIILLGCLYYYMQDYKKFER